MGGSIITCWKWLELPVSVPDAGRWKGLYVGGTKKRVGSGWRYLFLYPTLVVGSGWTWVEVRKCVGSGC